MIQKDMHMAFTEDDLRNRIAFFLGHDRVPKQINIVTDTSDFYRVGYDDVIVLQGRAYFVRNNEREGRFGIDEQQKFWVKRAIDLSDGSIKILKLTFLERFIARVGELSFECYRSPKKEARILELVRNDNRFMQGFSALDSSGNIVRVIDFIHGETLADTIISLGSTHEDYFFTFFPTVLNQFIEMGDAIKFLHDHEEIHGDIRRDHILMDRQANRYRWIDFDYGYFHTESRFGYDLFGLGNVLVFLAARGDVTVQHLQQDAPHIAEHLGPQDVNIIFSNRLVNLRKLYPYIPETLNTILLHFAAGSETYYEHINELLEDLYAVRALIK
jgi:tRNA A-37 threonylcarbamoyl transferase component Bud32